MFEMYLSICMLIYSIVFNVEIVGFVCFIFTKLFFKQQIKTLCSETGLLVKKMFFPWFIYACFHEARKVLNQGFCFLSSLL